MVRARNEISLVDGEVIRVPADMRVSVIQAFIDEYNELVRRERGEPGQWIDGDLLAMFIVESCPRVLTQRAAEQTAEKTLAELAGIEGMTIVRGPHGRPWKPESVNKAAPICCEHAG